MIKEQTKTKQEVRKLKTIAEIVAERGLPCIAIKEVSCKIPGFLEVPRGTLVFIESERISVDLETEYITNFTGPNGKKTKFTKNGIHIRAWRG